MFPFYLQVKFFISVVPVVVAEEAQTSKVKFKLQKREIKNYIVLAYGYMGMHYLSILQLLYGRK